MPYVKSSSGAVVSTVRTAISAPVFAWSSVASASMRARTSGGSTPARSVTKPRGVGIGGSDCASAAVAASRTRATAILRMQRVHGCDHPLGVREVARELRVQLAPGQAGGTAPPLEHAMEGGQRADDALARGQHVAVGVRRLVAAQVEHVTEDHEEGRERVDEQPLEITGPCCGVEIERAEPE